MAAFARGVRAPPEARKKKSRPSVESKSSSASDVVQAKLQVGPAGDRYEQEADRIADSVARGAPVSAHAPPPVISGLSAQRSLGIVKAGPEKVEEADKPPEQRAQGDRRVAEGTTKNAVGTAGGPAPPAVEAAMTRLRNQPAAPIGPDLRAQLEARTGADLSAVRLHTGSTAAEAANGLGARAFTVGRDIVFGQGQYQPETTEGQRLIAHEVVHTVQQSGGAARARRNNGGPTATTTATPPPPPPRRWPATGTSNQGWIDLAGPGRTGGTLHIPTLQMPYLRGGFKGDVSHPSLPGVVEPQTGSHINTGTTPPLRINRRTRRGSMSARRQWLAAIPALSNNALSRVHKWDQNEEPVIRDGQPIHYFRLRRDADQLLLSGTATELASHDTLKIPEWDRRGRFIQRPLEIDHIHELQLGGRDGIDNFWALNGRTNGSSGGIISNQVRNQTNALLNASEAAGFWTSVRRRRPEYSTVRRDRRWVIEFDRLIRRDPLEANTQAWWTRQEIEQGDHLPRLVELSAPQLYREGLLLRPGDEPRFVSVFATQNGGYRLRFDFRQNPPQPLQAPATSPTSRARGFTFQHVVVSANDPITAPAITQIVGDAFRLRPTRTQPALAPTRVHLDVLPLPDFGFGGYIDPTSLQNEINRTTHFAPLSPLTFHEAGIDANGVLYANGEVTATKALFPGLVVPIRVRGQDIFIDFPIPTERLSLGPVSVTEAALSLGYGEHGLAVEGFAHFMVDQLGEGSISGRMGDNGPVLTGSFDVDLDFLETARAEVVYDFGADTLQVTLTAGVGEGALPGVTGGEVTLGISRTEVSVSGTMRLAPPLDGATVIVSYSQANGLVMGVDDVPLPVDRLPGVDDATVSIRVARNPEGQWRVSGTGRANFAASGATGFLAIEYDSGALTATGRVEVERGPASGWLQITGTNRPIDEEGNPVEDGTPGELSIFGRGQATIAFGPFLEGTAGIEYTPDGRTIITGTIAVRPRPLFAERSYRRELLNLEPPEFPIWGVSVGGVGIGIFAFVNAVVRFEASVGPGELQDTYVTATIDLDRPEQATVEGNARFFVPAYVGLTLDLGGGLRARIAVAYVQGRVGLEGTLGIEADASAQVNVAWNRQDGFSLRTELEANARPKFEVAANASITAGVDLLVTDVSKTWGPWRRTLGEFGPSMELGATFPVSWSEQNGLDLSLDNIQIRRPSLDAAGIMSDAFDRLV